MPVPDPDYARESALRLQGFAAVCGVDEVGRGPLAGPVTAAAVLLDPKAIPDRLNDSKTLAPAARLALARAIHATSVVSIAHASVAEIDRMNILRASHLAMVRALRGLGVAPDFALIDGNRLPAGLPCAAEAIVKGDGKSLSISAASIVAKVCRDRVMMDLAQQYPGYGWERNAGYPTRAHVQALRDIGVTPHHRRSFRPVHNILYQEKSVTP